MTEVKRSFFLASRFHIDHAIGFASSRFGVSGLRRRQRLPPARETESNMLEDADAFIPFAGKNGQLFIGKAGGIDLVDLFGKAIAPGRLLQWRRAFERRGRELKRRDIRYVVNFAPSAHIVCAGDLPDDLAGKLSSPVPALLKTGPIENVTFIDSLDALRRPGAEFGVYRKTARIGRNMAPGSPIATPAARSKSSRPSPGSKGARSISTYAMATAISRSS